MNRAWLGRIFVLILVLSAGIAIGCGSGAEGKYRDPTGTLNAQFQDGKAYLAFGAYAVDGTYKIEGDKITAKGDFGPMIPSPLVFTINKDGSIDGPRDSVFTRLEKVK
ncbi:MAG TPA: hypothetical protein VGD60_16955 [Candidatus Acidoferrales bacterium]